LEKVAPLLCAGITTYSPLKQWNVKRGDKLAVVGLGGLGHMAVKLAASMGSEVTVLSRSKGKQKDAQRLGAHHFEITTDENNMKCLVCAVHLISHAASAEHDYYEYRNLSRTNGVMLILAAPTSPSGLPALYFIGGRISLVGSLLGLKKETQ